MKSSSLVLLFGFINVIRIQSPVHGHTVAIQPGCGCSPCDVSYVTTEYKPCMNVALSPALECCGRGVYPNGDACGCGVLDLPVGFLDLYAPCGCPMPCGCGLSDCPCPKYLKKIPIPPPFL